MGDCGGREDIEEGRGREIIRKEEIKNGFILLDFPGFSEVEVYRCVYRSVV